MRRETRSRSARSVLPEPTVTRLESQDTKTTYVLLDITAQKRHSLPSHALLVLGVLTRVAELQALLSTPESKTTLWRLAATSACPDTTALNVLPSSPKCAEPVLTAPEFLELAPKTVLLASTAQLLLASQLPVLRDSIVLAALTSTSSVRTELTVQWKALLKSLALLVCTDLEASITSASPLVAELAAVVCTRLKAFSTNASTAQKAMSA